LLRRRRERRKERSQAHGDECARRGVNECVYRACWRQILYARAARNTRKPGEGGREIQPAARSPPTTHKPAWTYIYRLIAGRAAEERRETDKNNGGLSTGAAAFALLLLLRAPCAARSHHDEGEGRQNTHQRTSPARAHRWHRQGASWGAALLRCCCCRRRNSRRQATSRGAGAVGAAALAAVSA